MWFKHLHLYRLHDAPFIEGGTIAEHVEAQETRPLGGTEARRIGWAAPAGRNSKRLYHQINGQFLLSALHQERILPASVVREEVEARAAEREDAEGGPLLRREKQALKEQVYEEFLPRAFVRTQRIDLWWDTQRQLIAVNASSRKRAEDVLDLLRQTLGSLRVTPLATKATPTRAMTKWLHHPETRPAWLLIGDQAVLESHGENSAITARRVDMDGGEVAACLEAGRQVTRMAITVDEQASLVLTDDLTLKSLRFSDALLDEASQNDDGDDPVLRLETDFVLMTGALGSAIQLLVDGLGGEATAVAPAP